MKKISVHDKAVVLVLNKREAAAIARILTGGYLVEGRDSKNLQSKLISALELVGENPKSYGFK
jgi:hypothetical protein